MDTTPVYTRTPNVTPAADVPLSMIVYIHHHVLVPAQLDPHHLVFCSATSALLARHLTFFASIMADSLRAPEPSYFMSPMWKSQTRLDSPNNSVPGTPITLSTPGTPNEGSSLQREKTFEPRDLKRSLFKLNKPPQVCCRCSCIAHIIFIFEVAKPTIVFMITQRSRSSVYAVCRIPAF